MIMTIEEAITQLKDLRKDIESFEKNDEPDSVFAHDIEAIDIAVKALEETAELKRLLRLAVEDIERFRTLMSSTVNKDFCETALEYHCNPYDLCNSCPLSGSAKCKWRYADEAMKLIGGMNDDV